MTKVVGHLLPVSTPDEAMRRADGLPQPVACTTGEIPRSVIDESCCLGGNDWYKIPFGDEYLEGPVTGADQLIPKWSVDHGQIVVCRRAKPEDLKC